jgi:hypothetical protein
VPLCVLDAIFSINARYEGVRAAVLRYAEHYKLPVQRPRDVLPPAEAQVTVGDLIDQITDLGPDRFANDIVRHRSRTSPRGGILKAEASLRFAEALRDHDVQVLQEFLAALRMAPYWTHFIRSEVRDLASRSATSSC